MATVELSVFGLGSQIDVTSETLALAGVVGFTVAFEMGAHRLEHSLAGTPYMGMLAKIYKELMIMGFISLGVFLTLQFGSVGSTIGFYTFEFAHIVIFFTTLIFVMQACLMMVLSSQLKKRYEKSTNISVDHLLTLYSLHRKSKLFHARWLPFSDFREVMEFKIVQSFFRTTFALPTTFNFALYMREATDSHILALVDVESSTWVILAGVCFLNLARIKIWQMTGLGGEDSEYHADDDHAAITDDHATAATADDDHYDDDHHRRRWLGGGGDDDAAYVYDNTGSDGEAMFIISGWLMLALAAGNYFMSRWVELRLLKKAGCEGTLGYCARLTVIEKQTLEAKRVENERRTGFDNDHLKTLRRQVDQAKEDGRGHHRHHSHRRKKESGSEDERSSRLQSSISRHIGQAKRHAQALSTRVGSGNLKKDMEKGSARSPSPPRTFFRLGSKGASSKVLAGVGGHAPRRLLPLHDASLALGGGLEEPLGGTTVVQQSQRDDSSEPLRRARTDSAIIRTVAAAAAGSTTPTTTAIAAGASSLELLPSSAELITSGDGKTEARAGATGGGGRPGLGVGVGAGSYHAMEVSDFDGETSSFHGGCEYGSSGSDSDQNSPGRGQSGSTGSTGSRRRNRRHRLYETEQGGLLCVGEEGKGKASAKGEEDEEFGGQRGGRELVVAAREKTQGQRYSTGVPSFVALPTDAGSGGGGDGGGGPLELEQSPLEVFVKRPLSLIDEATVSKREQGGGSDDENSQDDDDTDDDDDSENSYTSFSRRPSASFSQMSSAGRRASVSIRQQARRLSRRVSRTTAWKQTSKLAMDVSKAAGKLTRVSSGVPHLNLFNDISDIYPLGSPTLFHKTLDVLLLLSCTYLALWAVNFMIVANGKPYACLRHMAMLMPAAGVFLFNALSVKTSSLLLAISAMDPDIIGKVIDEQMDEAKLVVQFRERLTSRLRELDLGQSGLAAAFEEVDVAGKGELTIKELSHVLFTLNFHASKDKYRKIFNVMDKNRKGVVSYHQLCELVYNEEAADQEAMALKMKGKMHAIK